MKIVDEKGKLFGLINIIDLCVIIIILLVVGFIGYKYVGKKITNPDTSSISTIMVDVKCAARSEKTSEQPLKVGDKLVSLTSFSNAVVTAVKYAPALVNVTTDDGRVLNVVDPRRKDCFLTFKMTADLSLPLIKLGSQEIAVGGTMIVKTNRVNYINGVIQDIRVSK